MPASSWRCASCWRRSGSRLSRPANSASRSPTRPARCSAENAAIKAEAAASASGLPAFADDSGLCVNALDGAPGLFSARWAGPSQGFRRRRWPAIAHELDRRGATERRAHFVSALVIAWPDGHAETFEGRVFGELVPPRGHARLRLRPAVPARRPRRGPSARCRRRRSTGSTGRRAAPLAPGARLRAPGGGVPAAAVMKPSRPGIARGRRPARTSAS